MQTELRIHGVSGTPADDMLGGPTIPDARFPGEPPTVLHPRDGDSRVLAYRWASQTSGTASSAMWLLLVPYMLLNVAGWALPPASDRRHRAAVAATRASGLLLTLVFALVVANGVIGVGAYQVVRRTTSWDTAVTLGVVVSSVVMGILWFATTRGNEARNDRPYLRSPHIAIALWGVWASTVTAVAETSGTANPIGSMWLLPVSLLALVAAGSVWHGLEEVTRVLGRLAILAATSLLISAVVRPAGSESELPEALTALGGPLRGALVGYLLAAVLTTGLAWSRRHPDAGPAVGTLLALAGSTGAAVGAGSVVLAGAAFGIAPSASTGALAEAFLVGALLIGVCVALHVWTHLEPAEHRSERLFLTLVSVRDDLRPLLLAVPVVSLVMAVVALGGAHDTLGWIGLVAGLVLTAGAALVAIRVGFIAPAVVVAVVGLAAIGSVVTGLATFRATAVGFTLVLPALAVASRIVRAVGDGDRRRILAIPWDVGSFFARRFHPFAPPTYRDAVERDLRAVLSQLRATADAVVVSAHSQGSIVAAAALDRDPDPRFSLLTYGSPLGSLYMRFFPISFPPDVTERIGVRPWINLWRPTDPIGGAILGPLDDRRIDDPHLRIHGGYWLADEPEYHRALAELVHRTHEASTRTPGRPDDRGGGSRSD